MVLATMPTKINSTTIVLKYTLVEGHIQVNCWLTWLLHTIPGSTALLKNHQYVQKTLMHLYLTSLWLQQRESFLNLEHRQDKYPYLINRMCEACYVGITVNTQITTWISNSRNLWQMTVQTTAHSGCMMICSNFWIDTFKQQKIWRFRSHKY